MSLDGAKKLSDHLGRREEVTAPVDLAMISLIRSRLLSAYIIIPPIFTPFMFGDQRDSDIDIVYLPLP